MTHKLWPVLSLFLVLLAFGSIGLAACSRPGTATANGGSSTPTPNSGGSGNCANGTVHTLTTTFQESCVKVAKGSTLQIVPVAQSLHILANGSWINGNQVPMKEAGAPAVNNVQLASSPISIGPFTTAGTYHIFCTTHPNMNLTIIVT